MPRPSRDELFMEFAQLTATRGTCLRKQVGAVLVRENRIISIGYNGAPPEMDHCLDVGCGGGIIPVRGVGEPTDDELAAMHWESRQAFYDYPNGCTRAIHAELNALLFSARHGVPTDDAAMYCTCATCATCAASLVAAGVRKFTYLEPYRITDGLELLEAAGVEVKQWTP